jgi:hypothetical protein
LETAQHKTVNRAATVQPAAAPKMVQRKAVAALSPVRVQTATKISSPHDPAEREAEATAKKIMRMAAPESSVAYVRPGGGVFRLVQKEEKEKKLQTKLQSPYITRFAASGVFTQRKKEETIHRQVEGQSTVAPNVAADIQSSTAGGTPLPLGVRRFMEPRFRADFSQVRIHTGDNATRLNRQVNAQAFTLGNQIFFGKDKFKPESQEGQELIAHELTHTIQQGAAIQRSEEVNVTQRSPTMVQRLGIGDALNFFADKANLIPGFRMFTIILGVNPINMSRVERSAANILRALIEFLPGGGLITQALENNGVFDKVGAWVEQQIRSLGMAGSTIKQAITAFLDSLSWSDIFDLGGVWERAKRIFTEPISRIINFGKGLVGDIINFIKNAILMPLAKLAEGTPGWGLLCAVLGFNPITGASVPRTAETLIGGFMKLIGQEEVWENMKKSNAVGRAWAWFQGALGAVVGFVKEIPTLFMKALKSLEVADIVLVPRAFAKLVGVFGSFAGRFFNWAGSALWNLLEIIFDVVSPGAFFYIKKTGAALKSILKNPLPFVGNLVNAAKQGFLGFASRFLTHLQAGLINWLIGALPGVYIPKAFELGEIVKFVFSVLDLTWENVRAKLVKVVGEPVVKAMETGFDIVVTLVTQGPAAAWDKIKEQLTNLKDMVIGGIINFVVETVVTKAIPKLISLFIPGAGFISAILSIYDMIMVFVNKLAQIAQVVKGFIDSIVDIAAGSIGAAAAKVESILANLLSLAINFLAGFIGLGKVADKIKAVLEKVRGTIDKALDALIAWIVKMAKTLWKKASGAVSQAAQWWRERRSFRTAGGASHELFFAGDEHDPRPMVASGSPQPIFAKLDHYTTLARAADAGRRQRDALPVIARVRSTLGTRPDDASIVNDMKILFEVFDEQGTTVRQTQLVRQSQAAYGGSQVAVHMVVDWLDAAYGKSHGSPPQSGAISAVMGKLVTDPSRSGENKYVKGHLLNEKLGGEGDDRNLFPITAIANSRHLHSTESTVKRWLGRPSPKRWVWYEVRVGDIHADFPLPTRKSPSNFVNATFNCHAILKDESGETKESFLTTVRSQQASRPPAERFDLEARRGA